MLSLKFEVLRLLLMLFDKRFKIFIVASNAKPIGFHGRHILDEAEHAGYISHLKQTIFLEVHGGC